MPTALELMAQIDADITNKVTGSSITPANVGDNMKDIVSYVDQEVNTVSLPYKVYSATINQSGTSAPTVVVLENTLSGNPVFTRLGSGSYFITLNNAFVINKCWQVVNQSDPSVFISVQRQSANIYAINSTQGGVSSDDIIQNASLEIRIYN